MSAGAVYFGSAAIVALLGAALLAWALFADRAKGRKRCPKCWYDMSAAVNLRCPECGWEVKHEKQLLKTRRRWKAAFATLLPFALADFLALQPKVQRDGWWSVMPTTVMLAYFQFKQDDAVVAAIDYRMTVEYEHPDFVWAGGFRVPDTSSLWKWQWRHLARLVIDSLDDPDLAIGRVNKFLEWASTMQDVFEHDPALRGRLTEAMARYLNHDDAQLRTAAALFGIDQFDPEGTVERLLPLLEHDDAQTRRAAVTALRLAAQYTRSDVVLAELVALIDHPDPDVVGWAAWALGSMKRLDELSSDRAAQALHAAVERTAGTTGEVRSRLLRALAEYLVDDELAVFVAKYVSSDDPYEREAAFVVLSEAESLRSEQHLDDVIRELDSDDATDMGRWSAAHILRHWQRPELLRPFETTLRRLVRHSDVDTRGAAYEALLKIGVEINLYATEEPEDDSP